MDTADRRPLPILPQIVNDGDCIDGVNELTYNIKKICSMNSDILRVDDMQLEEAMSTRLYCRELQMITSRCYYIASAAALNLPQRVDEIFIITILDL